MYIKYIMSSPGSSNYFLDCNKNLQELTLDNYQKILPNIVFHLRSLQNCSNTDIYCIYLMDNILEKVRSRLIELENSIRSDDREKMGNFLILRNELMEFLKARPHI